MAIREELVASAVSLEIKIYLCIANQLLGYMRVSLTDSNFVPMLTFDGSPSGPKCFWIAHREQDSFLAVKESNARRS